MSRVPASIHTRSPSPPPAREAIPPLESGDHLTRAEFERRYNAHPEIKKAELVQGVVFVTSAVRARQHGRPHSQVITWLGVYEAATPGVMVLDNATLRVDEENEPQPDAMMRLEPELGGRSWIDEEDYVNGAPELIVEIAASSAALDLHAKKRLYERIGVQEYVAVQMYEQRVDWFALQEGQYQSLEPDEKGVLRSRVFPGLWLDPQALLKGDLARVLQVLQKGLASPEHKAFVEKLRASIEASSSE